VPNFLSSGLLATTLQVAEIGLFVLDRQHRVRFWNDWLERHTGLRASDVLGLHLDELFPRENLLRLNLAVKAAIDCGMTSVLSQSINGALLPLFFRAQGGAAARIEQSICVKPVRGDAQRYCLVQVSDVSAGARREDALRHQAEKRRQLADRYRASEAQLRAIIDNMADALVTIDAVGCIAEFNPSAERLFGYTKGDMSGMPMERLFPSGYAPRLRGLEPAFSLTSEALSCDGHRVPVELSIGELAPPLAEQRVLIFRDLTYRRRIEDAIYRERQLAQVTLESISESVLTTDAQGKVNFLNDAARALLGVADKIVVGRSLIELLGFVDRDVMKEARRVLSIVLEGGASGEISNNAVLRTHSARMVDVDLKIAPLRDKTGRTIGSVTALRDVTQARRLQARLSYQATHDELTGLINRRELQRRLEDLLWRSNTDEFVSALLYIDLDQFKLVNDTCGHEAGDRLLVQLTQHLGLHLRRNDTLARLGGDEFSVLLPGCSGEAAQRIAETLREAVRKFRFAWLGRSFAVGASIGLVVLDGRWEGIAEAMSAADAACNMAKEAGRDRVIVYSPDGSAEQRHHGEMVWASRIREAIEGHRLQLYCQPVMPIGEDVSRGVYCEVLLRMVDDAGNLVAPMAFIPAAERYGLMAEIDRWVVEEVTRMWAEMPELFVQIDKIAINLSGQSLGKDGFLDYIRERMIAVGSPWDRFCFEITETALVANLTTARAFIEELVELGCSFSLDDFGSGLSSFTYLKHLPVNYLKIDGTFVKDMLTDQLDRALVRSISDIGRTLKLQTIGEYVENAAIYEALREAGVHYGQGFGICVPFPLRDLKHFNVHNLLPLDRPVQCATAIA
jgi:diguanylate cyclase (GGDEF)-like protein/PAS domain S-box-containing protein